MYSTRAECIEKEALEGFEDLNPQHLPPWARSFDLFRHPRVAIVF